MREILFRGKEKTTGEWVYGGYAKESHESWANFETYIVDDSVSSSSWNPCVIAVAPATVGQYTGLNDKNGMRIFEGDIIENRVGTYSIRYNSEMASFRRIVYTGNKESFPVPLLGTSHDEVIGNIHEREAKP